LDDSSSNYLIVSTLLIVLYALLTLTHTAYNNVRQSALQELASNGNKRAQQALAILARSAQFSATYTLLSMTLLFLIAIFAGLHFLLPALTAEPVAGDAVLFGSLALVGVGMLTLVLGNSVPEGVGSAHAEPIALILAPLVRLLVLVTAPLALALVALSRLIAGLFGGGKLVSTVTEEEILSLVYEGNTEGTIEDQEREMIYSVLQLDQTAARELMTPRMDIVAVDVQTPLPEALKTFIQSGFSRLPVYEENIDNIVGLVYAKDLLNLWQKDALSADRTVRDLTRPAYFVPEMKHADDLLRELQNRKVHMAIVVDEYGGTSGLVTIENLIEEIVGDILDEYDIHEEAEYTQNGNGEYIVDASMDLDDFNELLDVEFDSDENDTLGGFIYSHVGRVPDEGEIIETEELILKVLSIDGRRIRKVEVTPRPPEETEATDTNRLSGSGSASDETPTDTDTPPALADAS